MEKIESKIFLLISLMFCEIWNQEVYVNNDENICESQVCVSDAIRLLATVKVNESSHPCDDFREFALGKIIEENNFDEKYGKSSFQYEVAHTHLERYKRLLLEPIDENDGRLYKIAKNFFQKCVDPDYVYNQRVQEISEYLRDKNFPLIDRDHWQEESVNITKTILDTSFNFAFFTLFRVTRCLNPNDPESEIICFKFSHKDDEIHRNMLIYVEKTRQNFLYRFQELDLNVDQSVLEASIDQFLEFIRQIWYLDDNQERERSPFVLKINEINSQLLVLLNKFKIDWLEFINSEFLEHSKAISDEEEVMIDDWELFVKTLTFLESTPIKMLMDVFSLGFFKEFEHVYSWYNLSRTDFSQLDDFHREDQCLRILESYFSPVLLSLYAKNYLNENHLEELEIFIHEVIRYIPEVLNMVGDLDDTIIDDLSRKLNKIKITTAVHPEILKDGELNEMYKELELTGYHELLETSIKLKKHAERLNNEFKKSWYYRGSMLSSMADIKYIQHEDFLFIPVDYVVFPYYDRNRPRFYNTATLATEIVLNIYEGLKSYLRLEYRIIYLFDYDNIQLSYKNYLKWDEINGNTEKRLPGFGLTNRQMYWLAYANTYYEKYSDYQRISPKMFHVQFKAKNEFREAFGCNEMTEDEINEFNLFKAKSSKV